MKTQDIRAYEDGRPAADKREGGQDKLPDENFADRRDPDAQNTRKQANKGYDIPLTGLVGKIKNPKL